MSEELIREIENLIEFGYGDTNRLDSIVNALENGQPLYPSDQKYVDMLVSKYVYPHVEEFQDQKNQIESLEQKIENMKEKYHGNEKEITSKNIPANYCNSCGSTMLNNYEFCPKCGSYQEKNKLKRNRKSQIKPPRNVASIILGVLGGLIAIGVGIFAELVYKVSTFFTYMDPNLWHSLVLLSFVGGILGIIGGSIGRTAGGILSIIASILALVGGGGFGILPFILLIIGGIISLAKER
ncbi:MAG: hypothetical protein WA799_04100 [Nitrosotalea sp.]